MEYGEYEVGCAVWAMEELGNVSGGKESGDRERHEKMRRLISCPRRSLDRFWALGYVC